MSAPNVPAGPEAAPTLQTSPPVPPPASTPPANSTSLGTASISSVVFFLSFFALATLVAMYWIRKRRPVSKASDERLSEKEATHDVEARAATRPIVPVTPLPDVRWAPQIRSISGPVLEKETHKKSASTFPKRARSPPFNSSKTRHFLSEPYPKSAPAQALSFSQQEIHHTSKSPRGDMSPPVTPLALAVSGAESRSLGRPGLASKNVVEMAIDDTCP